MESRAAGALPARSGAHYVRMGRSARILGLDLPHGPGHLVGVTAELLRRNGVRGDAYVRPLLLQAGSNSPCACTTRAPACTSPPPPCPATTSTGGACGAR
nr:hypothetical protein GCM10020093_025340 [Planobispora longispora]